METLLKKRGLAIASSAILFPLRAAAGSSHFERFARRDSGWSAQSSSLSASSRANFLIQERGTDLALSRAPRDRKPAF
jgi:hypothetical protein